MAFPVNQPPTREMTMQEQASNSTGNYLLAFLAGAAIGGLKHAVGIKPWIAQKVLPMLHVESRRLAHQRFR